VNLSMTTETATGPFSPSDFRDGRTDRYDNPYFPPKQDQRNRPEGKAKTANALIAFLEAGCPRDLFTEDIYHALSQKLYGHAAEFTIHGFYGSWFETKEQQARWVERAEKGGPYGFSDPERPILWGDVERAIAAYLVNSGLGLRIRREAAAAVEEREKEQLAALVAKYPDTTSVLLDEVARAEQREVQA